MPSLPAAVRSRVPDRLRDDVRLRALAVGIGAIPPRTMHSEQDAAVLLRAARGARRVVEIGVYEGSSAVELCRTLAPDAELHLIDPFGHHPDALPSGWGAIEWATRRTVARASRGGPQVRWHIALSDAVAERFTGELDLVFIDGDHSEAGAERDWDAWSRFVRPSGHVVLHDARADQPGGRGLPGPTAVVARRIRSGDDPGWEIDDEADRTVAVRRR